MENVEKRSAEIPAENVADNALKPSIPDIIQGTIVLLLCAVITVLLAGAEFEGKVLMLIVSIVVTVAIGVHTLFEAISPGKFSKLHQ